MDMAIVLGTYTSSPSYTGLDPTVEGAWMVDEREERNDRFFMTELSQEEPTGAYVVDVKWLKVSMPMGK